MKSPSWETDKELGASARALKSISRKKKTYKELASADFNIALSFTLNADEHNNTY